MTKTITIMLYMCAYVYVYTWKVIQQEKRIEVSQITPENYIQTHETKQHPDTKITKMHKPMYQNRKIESKFHKVKIVSTRTGKN